jgi:hypothetical protein
MIVEAFLLLTGSAELNEFEDYLLNHYKCRTFVGEFLARPTKRTWKRLKREHLIPKRIVKDVELHADQFGVDIK